MNLNAEKLVYKFNKEAGLLNKLDWDLENSMALEEIYERMGISNAKEEARAFVKATNMRTDLIEVLEVDKLDSLTDEEVIIKGTRHKMGLTVQQNSKALGIVMQANLAKLKNLEIDDQGKVKKDKNFVSPEPLLQKLLDER